MKCHNILFMNMLIFKAKYIKYNHLSVTDLYTSVFGSIKANNMSEPARLFHPECILWPVLTLPTSLLHYRRNYSHKEYYNTAPHP
jgi:hypothetical protein